MEEKAHARLSASSAHRWLACPPSVSLEEQFPQQTSSYAEEGTKAHALAEVKIKHFVTGQIAAEEYRSLRGEFDSIPVDMEEATDEYLDYVREAFSLAKADTPDTLLYLEQKVDFSDAVPEGFGTSDCIIISDQLMEVIDYKHGKGVAVSAVDNPQARLYAYGALKALGELYEFSEIKSTIIQPRLGGKSSEILTRERLEDWIETEVKPKAKLAFAGEGEFQSGSHCKFCRAAAICREHAEEALKIARGEFKEPELLSDPEIVEALGKLDDIEDWVKAFKEYTLKEALTGHNWEGYKVVEGVSRRKYTDEQQVIDRLKSLNYDLTEIADLKLKGITDMTKLLGKKEFEAHLSDLVDRPQGKPTLVPITDKRPEYNSVEQDFREE